MKKSIFKEIYPILSIELIKQETNFISIDSIIKNLKEQIKAHPVATFIAIFDHYEHTKSIGGEINNNIKNIKNLVFCFGAEIPKTTSGVLRPKSISIAELEDKFIIEFLEPPKQKSSEIMQEWVKSLVANNSIKKQHQTKIQNDSHQIL